MAESNDSCGGGSCLGLILFIFLVYGLFNFIPTPWGSFSYDISPPAIHQLDG